ncbi:hypothetical protein LIA77_10903 [Sarocladium implicatum]|nr:hypothetical protein LIA77_10903 [Sarocladium implicatum]
MSSFPDLTVVYSGCVTTLCRLKHGSITQSPFLPSGAKATSKAMGHVIDDRAPATHKVRLHQAVLMGETMQRHRLGLPPLVPVLAHPLPLTPPRDSTVYVENSDAANLLVQCVSIPQS